MLLNLYAAVCSAKDFWRWTEEIVTPIIVQAYSSEQVRLLGIARLRQIRSRQSNYFDSTCVTHYIPTLSLVSFILLLKFPFRSMRASHRCIMRLSFTTLGLF